MRLFSVLVLIVTVLTIVEAGVLTNVRSFILGTVGKVKDRLAKRNEHVNATTAIVLDVTVESIEDTVDYLTAENDELRRTNVALRTMVRSQKKQLADLRKEKESIRRELTLRLSEVEKQHDVDKEGLRKRLEQEHQGEMSIMKAEMLQKVASKADEAEAAVQLTLKQLKQIATYEAQEAVALKDIAELKRELRDKEAAMKDLEKTSTAAAGTLKQEIRVKEGLIKELATGGTSGSGSASQKASTAGAAVEVSASGSTVRSDSSSSSISGSSSSSGSGSEAEAAPKIDLMKDLAKKAIGGGKTATSSSSSSTLGQAKKRKEPTASESKQAPVTTSSSSLKRSSLPKKSNHKPRSTPGGSPNKGPSK
jgi:hypothetical protein